MIERLVKVTKSSRFMVVNVRANDRELCIASGVSVVCVMCVLGAAASEIEINFCEIT